MRKPRTRQGRLATAPADARVRDAVPAGVSVAPAKRGSAQATPPIPRWGVIVRKRGNAHVAQFFVEAQGFDLVEGASAERATWFGEMFLKALEKLGVDVTTASRDAKDSRSDY